MSALAILTFIRSNWKLLAIGALALGVVAGIATIYHKGEKAGGALVTDAVQKKTIDTLQKATTDREKAHEGTLRTPYADRVEQLP